MKIGEKITIAGIVEEVITDKDGFWLKLKIPCARIPYEKVIVKVDETNGQVE